MHDKSKKQSRLKQGMINTSFPQLTALVFLCLSAAIPPSSANAEELDKAVLKALYTYQFGKFTEWPKIKLNPATGHFKYCILGRSQFSQQSLNMITGKSVQGLPLTIEVFNSGLVPEEVLSACHILFVSRSEKHRLYTILASLKQDPVLTVSDIQEFSEQGGMITLVEDRGKLRFQINPKAVQQAELSVSSKMMELAEIVNERQQ